jgi:hypothetical protein
LNEERAGQTFEACTAFAECRRVAELVMEGAVRDKEAGATRLRRTEEYADVEFKAMKSQRDTLAHIAAQESQTFNTIALEAREYTEGHERLKTEYTDMKTEALLYTQQRETTLQSEIDNLRS